jgi:PelA/Pel-15E family pectate lyase
MAAQHPSGGWNYLYDFAGEESTKRWYDTIGRNGWRLEEFHHYYGNATFDDAGTSEASQFLLRMFMEKRDQRIAAALEQALRFVLASQYENGGWPQRYPFIENAPALHGRPDYTRYITFNDDVAGENIKFLLMIWQSLGDRRARDAIDRAMNVFIITQQPAPQAGWGLQHGLEDLRPVGARTYEPDALVTSTTAGNISLMLDFYEWTGDARFLERIPEAIAWLESVRLTGDLPLPGREFPTFIEIGTNRALINHRRGSNVVNGAYYQDYDPERAITHYSQWRAIDLDGLRARHERVRALAPAEAIAASPLQKQAQFSLPRLFTTRSIEVSDLNSNAGEGRVERPAAAQVAELANSLNDAGYWPTPLTAVSNPYTGDGSATPAPGDFSTTLVGDASDTSPHVTDSPEIGISTGTFIRNMSALLQVVDQRS